LRKKKGIGGENSDILLKQFKTVKNIKLKAEEELAAVIGKAKTKILLDYFQNT